tara:strand:+ start:22489 stop:23703 length:1215 start_codon:yes stop_codon:yes gene_type:complete
LKILIVSQYYWPENFRINEISSELKKEGNDVVILTGYPNYPEGKINEDFLKNPLKYSNYKGIKIIRVPIIPRGKKNLQLIFNYFSFVVSAIFIGIFKLRKYSFDMIFVFQTSPVFVGIPSSLIAFIKKCPQVFYVLDLWPETLTALGIIKSKWQLLIIRNIVKLIYSRCDLILVQSKKFVKEIKKYSKNKVLYFPAWVESEFINSPKGLAKEITCRENIFTIMFAGNIGKAQDFESLLKAAEYLVNNYFIKFRIIIIGEGSEKEWLIKEVKEKKLNNFFKILGRYPLNRMPSFFSHADVLLVSLSNKDVFNMTIPGKIQTYLASGKPIIGMLNGEGANIIRESKAGYTCNSGDYKELAKLIIKMSKLNPQSKSLLGKNGLDYCEKEFNKKLLINKLKVLMDNLK